MRRMLARAAWSSGRMAGGGRRTAPASPSIVNGSHTKTASLTIASRSDSRQRLPRRVPGQVENLEPRDRIAVRKSPGDRDGAAVEGTQKARYGRTDRRVLDPREVVALLTI